MEVAVASGARGDLKAVALVSSLEAEDPLADAIQRVKESLEAKAKDLVGIYEKKRETFWSASGVALANRDFQNWWYRQLYYFRCFSKPSVIAMGLQAGINTLSPWHGSYKINYNICQTFWTPFTYNHPDLCEPWVEHLYTLLPRGRWFAKAAYGCEGAAFFSDTWPHEVDPGRCSSPNKHQIAYLPWGYTMGMSGMGIQNLWYYHLYKPDPEYLKARFYPVLKEVATFYASFIEQCRVDDQGKAIIGPSYNPEHGRFGTNNNPYDITYVSYSLKAAIAAAEQLGVDKDQVERFRRALALVPPFPTTPDPQHQNKPIIANWRKATAASVTKYNIVVPAVPLFPGDQASFFSLLETRDLFTRTLSHVNRSYNRNNSVVMLNAGRARLSLIADAIQDTQSWFKQKELPNGLFHWKGHGYYMSEQTAVGALVNEFLVQSVEGIIRVFPAWPKETDARFDTLRAQGGFLVTAEQHDGEITHLEITSTAGGKLRLLSPWPTLKTSTGSRLEPDNRGLILLETTPWERLIFSRD